MTISTETVRGNLIGPAAVDDTAALGFQVYATSDVVVYLYSADGSITPLTEDVAYSITLDTPATLPSTGTLKVLQAVVAGDALRWNRRIPKTQSTDYTSLDKFPAESHERALDKATLLSQDEGEKTERAVSVRMDDDLTLVMEIPLKADRSSKVLAFDAAGEPTALANVPTAPEIALSALAQTLLVSNDPAFWRAAAQLDLLQDIFTTRGEILYRGAASPAVLVKAAQHSILRAGANDPEWLTPGSNADVLTIRAGAVGWDRNTPKGFRWGGEISSDATNPTTDVVFAAGEHRSEDDTVTIVHSGMTKEIDTGPDWTAGTNQPGRPASIALANDQTWHAFVIAHADGSNADYGFDTNIDASALLAAAGGSYATGVYRRLGSFKLAIGATTIERFHQYDRYTRLIPSVSYYAGSFASATRTLLTTRCPVHASFNHKIICQSQCSTNQTSTGNDAKLRMTHTSWPDVAVTLINMDYSHKLTNVQSWGRAYTPIDALAQLYWRWDGLTSMVSMDASTMGWFDYAL